MKLWHRGPARHAALLVVATLLSLANPRAMAEDTSQVISAGGDGSVAALHAADAATWPFDPPPLATLRQSPRKIFAHWHIFPISVDNKPADSDYWSRNFMRPEGEKAKYAAGGGMSRERPLSRPVIDDDYWRVRDMETDIRRAISIGLDGFLFNIVNPNPSNIQYEKLLAMLEAANRVDPDFRVALMIDAVANRDRSVDEVAAGILQVASHPSVYRTGDGRLVLSAFTPERKPVEWWQELFAKLGDAGVKVYFVPVFQGWKAGIPQFAAISEGFSDWGRRSLAGVNWTQDAAAEAHKLGKIWMAPVAPQDSRPKSLMYWEPVGSELFREGWKVATEGGADWVQLITWNDYAEATEIAPSTGTQYAFYDLSAYYAAWFKTGQQPPIARDVLYYFHRIMPAATQATAGQQERPFQIQGGEPPQDIIELLAFLTKPGTLEIEIAGNTYKQEAAAGITSFKVPLALGRPRFRLVRDGAPVIEFESAFEIRDKVEFQDFLYRAGSSSRPPVELIANPPLATQ